MRVLISATGSYGDIFPFVAIGRDLKRRGHDVRFFASSYFTPLAERSGLDAAGIGSPDAYEAVSPPATPSGGDPEGAHR